MEIAPKLNYIFKGEVATVQNFGGFIKIPGYKKHGLVHKSNISKSKIDDASEVLSVGDHVWCKVISLGDEDNIKIGLSMKYIDQGSGKDLDPNNVNLEQEERKKRFYEPNKNKAIVLEAVFNTTCKKCGTKGHLAKDCFSQPGSKVYDLVPEEATPNEIRTQAKDDEGEVKKKKKKHHKRKRSLSRSSFSEEDAEKKKKKAKKYIEASNDEKKKRSKHHKKKKKNKKHKH